MSKREDFDYVHNAEGEMEFEEIVKARDEGHVQHIDIRPAQMLTSIGKIPNTINMQTLDFYAENGALKSKEELQKMFAEKNIDLHKPMVFSCNAGIMANTGRQAARIAGATAPTYLYDGSYMEYKDKNQ